MKTNVQESVYFQENCMSKKSKSKHQTQLNSLATWKPTAFLYHFFGLQWETNRLFLPFLWATMGNQPPFYTISLGYNGKPTAFFLPFLWATIGQFSASSVRKYIFRMNNKIQKKFETTSTSFKVAPTLFKVFVKV